MLTEKVIRDARPEAKTRIIWDREVRGFGLRITAAGSKAFIVNYRADGRERRATIGRPSETSLKDARQLAGETLASVRAGADPLQERQWKREAAAVADGLDRFFGEFVPVRIGNGRMSKRTEADYRRQTALTIRPALGNLKIAAVTRQDVERAISKRAPVQRNRTLALLSRLFTSFEAWEYRPQHSNPCRGIEKAREEPRDRTLSPSELKAFGAALAQAEDENPIVVAVIQVAALTGLRISEVLAMRWQDVDLETGKATLPTTKTGRRIQLLSAPAVDVLSKLPRRYAWVFSTMGSPIGYKRARAAFSRIVKRADIADVRLHDLRRTVMTSAAMSGIGSHVLRDLLGHRTTAMADRYIRSTGSALQDATEAVGANIAAMMEGK